jgi:hypothetical protein
LCCNTKISKCFGNAKEHSENPKKSRKIKNIILMKKIKFVICAFLFVGLSYSCSTVQEVTPVAKNSTNVSAPNADAGSSARVVQTLTAQDLADNANFQKYLQMDIDFNAPSLATLQTKSKEELLVIKSQLENANADNRQTVYLSVMGVSATAYQNHLTNMNDQWKLVVEDFPALATMSAEQITPITNDAFNLYRVASGGSGCGWAYAGCRQYGNIMNT